MNLSELITGSGWRCNDISSSVKQPISMGHRPVVSVTHFLGVRTWYVRYVRVVRDDLDGFSIAMYKQKGAL